LYAFGELAFKSFLRFVYSLGYDTGGVFRLAGKNGRAMNGRSRFGVDAMKRTIVLFFALLIGRPIMAQTPTAADVKVLQGKFAEEKAKALAEGAPKFFLPGLVERAEELATRAVTAEAGGRFFQAVELYRQARWQLPYLPTKLPPHVVRVFGNFRLRHGMEVTAAAFSPDGKYLATGSSDRTVKLWDLGNGREARAYTKHTDQVRVIAFSPDGKTIASAGLEPDVHLWNVDTGEALRTIPGPGNSVNALAFSRDGKTLLAGHSGKAGGTSGYVTLTDVASGERKRTIQDFRLQVNSVAMNGKGDTFAVGVADGSIRLYSYPKVIENTNEPEFWAQQDNSGPVSCVAFSGDDAFLIRCGADGVKVYAAPQVGQAFQVSTPKRVVNNPSADDHFLCAMTSADGKTLIAGATDGILRMIDLQSGQVVSALRGHAGAIRSLALHPRGLQIASAGADCMVRLWDFDIVLQARDYAGHTAPVWSAAFSPDGKQIVSASGDQTVRVWDVGSAAQAKHVLTGHTGSATMAQFTPDGKSIVSAGADHMLKIWDAVTGKHVRDLTGHSGTITSFEIAADGTKLVSGGADRTVKVWDLSTGKEILNLAGQTSVVSAIAVHPSGTKFAVGNVDQTIGLYEISGKAIARWPAHGIAVSGLSFSPDGKSLASCGADMIVRVWSVDSPGADPVMLTGHTGPLSSVSFRKDSQHLVSCGADLSVKLWKLESDGGKELQTYRGHRDWVASANFSKDGYYVVSASVDRLVKIWEITSRDLPMLPEHTGTVDTVAFSPDGSKIASGSSDRTIKIWDRVTGAELTTIRGHTSNVIALAFTPDGKSLVSSSVDRSLRFWDPATGKEEPRSATRQQSFTNVVAASPLVTVTPDGKTLLMWIPGDNRYTSLASYDLEGNEKFTVTDQGRKVHSLCFSGDGRRAATGAANGSVRIWDLDKKPPTPIPGGDWFFFDEKSAVADLALTPDAKTIVVSSEQGDIKIADIATKKELVKSFKAHPGRINAVMISPDGKRFATLDTENTIKLWDLAKGEELRRWDLAAALQDRASSVLSLAFSPDGKSLAAGNANTTLFLLETP
jgi:WD40 repeat protein